MRTKIRFRQGYIHCYKGKLVNPTGYYVFQSFLFFFWLRVAGPFRHKQQAEKKHKELYGKI